ncbi:MAG: hypothetical protein ACLGHS_00435, partial [Actinomycetes bacterium]
NLEVVRTPDQAPPETLLSIRVSGGKISARSLSGIEPSSSKDQL